MQATHHGRQRITCASVRIAAKYAQLEESGGVGFSRFHRISSDSRQLLYYYLDLLTAEQWNVFHGFVDRKGLDNPAGSPRELLPVEEHYGLLCDVPAFRRRGFSLFFCFSHSRVEMQFPLYLSECRFSRRAALTLRLVTTREH